MSKKTKLWLYASLIIVFIAISVVLYITFANIESLSSFEKWYQPNINGYIIYVILVIAQVLFLPISTVVIIVPAIMLFSPFQAFYLSLIGLMIGSILAYLFGYFFSAPANRILEKHKKLYKWKNDLSKNSKVLLPYFSIVPIFPDELICIISGIVKINFWYFTAITFIAKVLHLVFICFLGAVIPMHDWWLVLYIAVLFILSYVCYILTKKQTSIKAFILRKKDKKN